MLTTKHSVSPDVWSMIDPSRIDLCTEKLPQFVFRVHLKMGQCWSHQTFTAVGRSQSGRPEAARIVPGDY
jgi:hypothetical protein